MKINHTISAATLLIIGIAISIIASIEFLSMRANDKIFPNATLSKIVKLSDYHPSLKNTNGDSDIYIFQGKEEGATILLLGGTHPNEPSGFMSAAVLVENINVETGRVIVIPQACTSGFSCTDPMEGYPEFFSINSKSGKRTFRYGSRVSNPLDQWPDPLVYSHFPSGQKLSGFETRNLNRAYPGRPDGTFTEQVAYAIVQLIKKENVDVAFDLHEAAPEIPIINAIVYHEKSEDIALNAILNLEMDDLKFSPERSPQNFHGLSHREWGDYTDAYPFLMETCNPIQGRLRGRTNEDLLLSGYSKEYKAAQATDKLRIEYDTTGVSLDKRVTRHLQGFIYIINSFNEFHPEKQIIVSNIPSYSELIKNGIGKYLQ